MFGSIQRLDVDAGGNVYLIDANDYAHHAQGISYAVRKIDAATGSVSTLYSNGPPWSGGALAYPRAIAVTAAGDIYVSNTGRNQIVRVAGRHRLEGIAGTGEAGFLDGPRFSARLSEPGSLAFTPRGSLVVVDQGDSMVRVIHPDPEGGFSPVALAPIPEFARLDGVEVTAFAGAGAFGVPPYPAGGFTDGFAVDAYFDSPYGMAFGPDGTVFIADTDNHAIRSISPEGEVRTVAGGNGEGSRNGSREEAQFWWPEGIAVDSEGIIYVADTGNSLIRRVASDGHVETFFGQDQPIRHPTEISFDREGNLLVSDSGRGRILRLSPDGGSVSVAEEVGAAIWALAVADDGTLFYVTFEFPNTYIRTTDPHGAIALVFGDRPGLYGGILSDYLPGVAVSTDGMIYVADWRFGRIVRITPGGEAAIVVDRSMVGEPRHFQPSAVLVTPAGDLLVADSGMSAIWKIKIGQSTTE